MLMVLKMQLSSFVVMNWKVRFQLSLGLYHNSKCLVFNIIS